MMLLPCLRLSLVLLFAGQMLAPPRVMGAPPVDYTRDIRPILSNACFKCHGPGTQKARLRLDGQSFAIKSGAIVPGKPDESTIFDRILSQDPEDRMPPPDVGEALTPAQVALLKAWIAQGAEYAPHWAFQPVSRPEPPKISQANTLHPIDTFIRQELAQRQMAPSPEADKATLIRRVTLDLIGLLPSPEEVTAFENDAEPGAYERLVDRLLASPHYGERQARHWLDLARYADSNGFTIDGPRSIWPWRDWVIAAFNADMPFDTFTIEQLAGDMLPKAQREQLIATGFHRNTTLNEEGGSDPEQFRVERTVDRTNTTATVWLGLTMGCAQCHDHKYDPVSQKDYYRLYAFFNSMDEPTLPVGGTPELSAKINELTTKANTLKKDGKPEEAVKIEKEIKKLQGKIPTTLILRERKQQRPTHVQIRGDFLRLGDEVSPGTPAVLPAATKEPKSRLDLARWLVSPENPLTARVVVNRYWQQFFGKGIVETENDFGIQGALPTHPALLDWLAAEFMQPNMPADAGKPRPWSTKHIHRLIVTSATYKQASHIREDLRDKDPNNRWLARQNRLRLEAEIIRDAALTASGKLSRKIGGPGVYPPQPPEVFSFTQSRRGWPESKGTDRYRRGMYTYIWRQSQHPLLATFDAADAQTPCTRRNRSNTPLQALHLANDPVFVELANALGERLVRDTPDDDTARLDRAFLYCFAREPFPEERERLLEYRQSLSGTPQQTWAAVARVLMNLDEFVTRE